MIIAPKRIHDNSITAIFMVILFILYFLFLFFFNY